MWPVKDERGERMDRYVDFLSACARRAGLTFPEGMANALMQKGDPKSNHPLQVLRGKREPGRDLLEKAAEIAGFSLSECLKLPGDAGLRAASGSGFTNIYEALTFVLKFGGDDDIDEIGKHLLRVKRDVAATESPPVLASKR